jgi:hypothetical protein
MRDNARIHLAMLCAFALLLPIVSISDETTTPSLDDAMLAIAIVVAAVLVAVARVHSAGRPAYAVAIATPSDPRSPPR